MANAFTGFGNTQNPIGIMLEGGLARGKERAALRREQRAADEVLRLRKAQINPWTQMQGPRQRNRNPLLESALGAAETYFAPETQAKLKMGKARKKVEDWIKAENKDPEADRQEILKYSADTLREFGLDQEAERFRQQAISESSSATAAERERQAHLSKMRLEAGQYDELISKADLNSAKTYREQYGVQLDYANALAKYSEAGLNGAKAVKAYADAGVSDSKAELYALKAEKIMTGQDTIENLSKDERLALLATGESALTSKILGNVRGIPQPVVDKIAEQAQMRLSSMNSSGSGSNNKATASARKRRIEGSMVKMYEAAKDKVLFNVDNRIDDEVEREIILSEVFPAFDKALQDDPNFDVDAAMEAYIDTKYGKDQ